jgi:hypothetical protein
MAQTLGLFSATAIVVGSMVGSGVYIVDADIARGTNSPALMLGAWVVTGVMTIIGALSYAELAAMMPKAGGQYVYLRESLGPLWGFLFGWTLFLVIQTGTIAAVSVAFGKFLGVFFPQVSATHWLWHIAHVPAWRVGPMVLGNMEIGVSTANLAGIVIVVLLRRWPGRGHPECLHLCQSSLTGSVDPCRLHYRAQRRSHPGQLRRKLRRILEERRLELAPPGAGWRWRAHGLGQSGRNSRGGAGGFAVLCRRVE